MKSKVILGTVAECTPSPPAHPTWQVSGINHHHHVPALGCPMPGPSVTSPSALSGAVHSLQHQGPGSALPQPFSSSSIAPFHHQFKFSALLGGTARGRMEVTVPAEPRRCHCHTSAQRDRDRVSKAGQRKPRDRMGERKDCEGKEGAKRNPRAPRTGDTHHEQQRALESVGIQSILGTPCSGYPHLLPSQGPRGQKEPPGSD